MQGKIQQLNDTLSQKETEYQAKIADMEFDAKLSELLKQSGVKNAKAAKALLDLDTLKASKNQDADIKTAVDACKEEKQILPDGRPKYYENFVVDFPKEKMEAA